MVTGKMVDVAGSLWIRPLLPSASISFTVLLLLLQWILKCIAFSPYGSANKESGPNTNFLSSPQGSRKYQNSTLYNEVSKQYFLQYSSYRVCRMQNQFLLCLQEAYQFKKKKKEHEWNSLCNIVTSLKTVIQEILLLFK